jgi:hypothetical protein
MPLKSALVIGLVGALVAAIELDGAIAGFALGAGWAFLPDVFKTIVESFPTGNLVAKVGVEMKDT